MIRLKYDLDADDYVDLNVTHVLRAPRMRRALAVQRWLVPGAGLVYFFVAERRFAVYFMAFAVAWLFFYPVVYRYLVRRRVVADVQKGASPPLGQRTLTVDKAGLLEVGSSGRKQYRWDEVERVEQSPRALHVFVTKNRAVIIPKRAVTGRPSTRELYDTMCHYMADVDAPQHKV